MPTLFARMSKESQLPSFQQSSKMLHFFPYPFLKSIMRNPYTSTSKPMFGPSSRSIIACDIFMNKTQKLKSIYVCQHVVGVKSRRFVCLFVCLFVCFISESKKTYCHRYLKIDNHILCKTKLNCLPFVIQYLMCFKHII